MLLDFPLALTGLPLALIALPLALDQRGLTPVCLYDLLRKSGFKTFVPVAQYGLRWLHRNRDVTNFLASR